MANQIVIDSVEVKGKLAAFRQRFLAIAAAKVEVVQAQQWQDAFRRGGQPGEKWKPLWADSYVGKVPQAAEDALAKATGAAVKLSERKKPATDDQWRKSKARIDKATRNLVGATSYRKGGQILVDDGPLRASWHHVKTAIYDTYAIIQGASAVFYAALHQTGFRTKGPNCIPLTVAFKTGHTKGANPRDEGFEEGVDYVMAWHGVNVPQRKLIDYSDPVNKAEYEDAMRAAAKQAAKGPV